MTIKIIKKGKAKKIMKGTCRECGCVAECEQSDATFQSDYRNGGDWVIKCPTCGFKFLYVMLKGD